MLLIKHNHTSLRIIFIFSTTKDGSMEVNKLENNKGFKCHECGKIFASDEELTLHLMRQHSEGGSDATTNIFSKRKKKDNLSAL